MSALVVTPYMPDLRSGRAVRTVSIIRALARLAPVEVAYVPFGNGEPASVLRNDPAISLRPIHPGRGAQRVLEGLRAAARGVPTSYARGVSAELTAAAHSSPAHDRTIADGPIAAGALLLGRRPLSVAYIAHNLESELAGQSGSSLRAGRLRRFERRLLELAEESWMPSERDLAGAAGLAPGSRLRLVPNAVDVAAVAPSEPAGEHCALFVGDYTYEPNRNAARFLLEQVMPLVWRDLPSARLVLAGRGLDAPAQLDPRVEITGFVDDLGAVYQRADCVLVPLLESGGSPLKLLEAMAYALPVVATSVAAAGVDGAARDVHYVEGDGAAGFSQAVVRTLQGQAGGVGRAGRALAEERFSIEALVECLR
jgi:glycosyltransferase involved in cell wall biosynthesis